MCGAVKYKTLEKDLVGKEEMDTDYFKNTLSVKKMMSTGGMPHHSGLFKQKQALLFPDDFTALNSCGSINGRNVAETQHRSENCIFDENVHVSRTIKDTVKGNLIGHEGSVNYFPLHNIIIPLEKMSLLLHFFLFSIP